jgi:hypothetical protein
VNSAADGTPSVAVGPLGLTAFPAPPGGKSPDDALRRSAVTPAARADEPRKAGVPALIPRGLLQRFHQRQN